jgi:hypothetical protein
LDVTNKRRFSEGMDYEWNPGQGDPRMSVYQHTYPDTPQAAMNMLMLQNQDAEALTGVKSFSGGLSGEAYGEVAAGIKGMIDAAALREMSILRRMAKGITDIGVKIASMNAVFLSEEETVRVTNKRYVKIRREDLKGNFDIEVDISTPEIDERKAADLVMMLQTMGPNMEPKMSYNILSEIADLKRMPELAENLRNYEPQPDPFAEQMKELELQLKQLEIQKIQSEIAKNMADAQKKTAEAEATDLEYVENETGTTHARNLENLAEQGRSNQNLEVTKSLLKTRKPEESRPEVEAAVGFNALTDSNPML